MNYSNDVFDGNNFSQAIFLCDYSKNYFLKLISVSKSGYRALPLFR